MNSFRLFQTWLSRRWIIILLIIILGAYLWLLNGYRGKIRPIVTHSLGSSTQHASLLWSIEDMFSWMAADTNNVVYVVLGASEKLAAIDIDNGNSIWQVELPNRGGIRELFVDQDTVLVITTISVDAYEANTGNQKWSTKLGTGHVTIFSQLDSGVIRVYYGDQLYEVDTKTGQILSQSPSDTVFWVSGDIVLRALSINQLTAFDSQSNEQLWVSGPLFCIEERQEPQAISDNIIIATKASGPSGNWLRGLCALDLRTGKYKWCHHETYMSRIAIDYQYQVGYAVRSDLVLVTIDLQTGDVVGETSFLTNGQPQEHPSFTSIAASNGVVIVSFGDSTQTFALKLR